MRSFCSLYAWSAVVVGAFSVLGAAADRSASAKRLDPAGWGSDHVGKPVPEYVTGDECLFCHRSDVGPAWPKNRHQRTIREAEPDSTALAALKKSPELRPFATDVTLLMGGVRSTRFLKKSSEYGKLDLLSAAWDTPSGGPKGKMQATESPHWDKAQFAQGCAGCHTTGVDSQTKAFSAVALDCYACHGEVARTHSKDAQKVHLPKKRQEPARVATSICAQCHVRTGKSRSTGRPYPDNFVAGDNLFRDFQVDFSSDALQHASPADRHVLENVRDVVVLGKEQVTCLTCHDIHKPSSRKHIGLDENDSCVTCHNVPGSWKVRKPLDGPSKTCQY